MIFLLIIITVISGCAKSEMPERVSEDIKSSDIKSDISSDKLIPPADTVSSAKGVLSGKITLASGNCMPTVCVSPPCQSGCSIRGVSRTIYLREIIKNENMNSTDLKEENKSKLIQTTISEANGTYALSLPIGTYIFSVEDDGGEYCEGLCDVEIKKDQTTSYDLQINHASW